MPDVTCSLEECFRAATCKGFCNPHYQRFYRYGDPRAGRPVGQYVLAIVENFWPRVDKGGPSVVEYPEMGPCWHWLGRLDIGGYGVFGCKRGVSGRAHRFSWALAHGEAVPDGAELDHVCHTLDLTCAGGVCTHRRCVNPGHLEPVTHRENALRSVRARTGKCGEGHDLVITTARDGNDKRGCPTCRANRRRELTQLATSGVRATPRPINDDLLADVARVYALAEQGGESPRLAVANHFTRSPGCAADWIRKARDRDFLPPYFL
jgi:hypothetical protein